MKKEFFEEEVEAALESLRAGEIILYPTDTIWGIGCDAMNERAIEKIYQLKKREDSKSMIILIAGERELLQYVAAPDPTVFGFMEMQTSPVTIIFDNAIGLPNKLIAADGSVAIRIVKDEFCRHLIKRLQHPLVSTSANISGQPSPKNFKDISNEIKTGVDHFVKWRSDEENISSPSRIIKWKKDGNYDVIR